MECIVCLAGQVAHFTTIDAQTYWRNSECNAIFLDHTHFSSARVEHAHYLGYDNRADVLNISKFSITIDNTSFYPSKTGRKGAGFWLWTRSSPGHDAE